MTSLDSSSSTITTSVSFNSTLQTLKFKAGVLYKSSRTITLANEVSCYYRKSTTSRLLQQLLQLESDTNGAFINEDGHISDDAMRIQDSLYYQDFSYVIKVGRAINDWRDSFKKTMHTSGFYFTGLLILKVELVLKFLNQLMVKYQVFLKVQSLELLVNYSLLSLVEDLEQLMMAHHKHKCSTRCGSRF